MHIQVRDLCAFAIEDLGQFFERRALRLDVEEIDEDELDKDPDLYIACQQRSGRG